MRVRQLLRDALLAGTVVVLLAATGCGGSTKTSSGGAPAAAAVQLAPKAAEGLLLNPPLGLVTLDVRTPGEFAAGHIEGAVNLDLQAADFDARLVTLDRATPYLVYCHSGNRSRQAVATMAALGFRHLYELKGGVLAWQQAGLRLMKDG